jgi:hypothetical protein
MASVHLNARKRAMKGLLLVYRAAKAALIAGKNGPLRVVRSYQRNRDFMPDNKEFAFLIWNYKHNLIAYFH